MQESNKSLIQLFIPICIETLFYMLAGMIDTLMLSTIGDQAVGAVGTSNTYISMFILMFSIVSTGMMAVMTQNIGAGKLGVAQQARNLGMAFNLFLGILLSLFLFNGSKLLLNTIGVSAALEQPASIYIRIVGGACFLNALIPIFSGYLRAFGYTKQPLWATIVANIVNFVLNALFLFVLQYGVAGVAAATVISRMVNLSIVMLFSLTKVHIPKGAERASSRIILGQIFKIGVPSAFESILYNISITMAIRFLNQMDSEGFNVAARAYVAQLANFSYAAGAALAQANGIMTGWRIGRHEYEACRIGTRKAWFAGIVVSLCLSFVIALMAPLLIPFFTDDPAMIAIVTRLIWIDVFLEFGRVTNLVYGNALKTCGDAIFPVVIGVVFMFLCTVLGTYVLGIRLGLLVTGCYIALACDECFRGVGMILRWQSGKWKGKGLVKS